MAKAKRERLRQAHLAPDYVSLLGPSILTMAAAAGGSAAGGQPSGTGGGGDDSNSEDDGDAQMAEMRVKFGAEAGLTKQEASVCGRGWQERGSGGGGAGSSGRGDAGVEVDEDDDAQEAFASAQLQKAIGRSAAGIAPRSGGNDGFGSRRVSHGSCGGHVTFGPLCSSLGHTSCPA